MRTELSTHLRSLDRRSFDVAGQVVTCWFGRKGESRRHAVRLTEFGDAIRFEATVATARTIEAMEEPHLWAWRRNRVSHIVGFRVGAHRRLVAEAVAPLIALSQEEFVFYLTTVAAEADRMELVLTAQDVQ